MLGEDGLQDAAAAPGLSAHLRWELGEAGDVHLLALRGQPLKQRLVGALGVVHGGVISLRGRLCSVLGWGGERTPDCGPPFGALTNILRCRAHTKPSPPLLPGPQTTNTAGGLMGKELGGYAWSGDTLGCAGWGWWGGGSPPSTPPYTPTLAMAVAQLSPASSISWSTLNLYSVKSSWSMA